MRLRNSKESLAVDGNLILVTQRRHEFRVKVLLLCQNKHIINMQHDQTLLIAQKTGIGIAMFEAEPLTQESADTFKPELASIMLTRQKLCRVQRYLFQRKTMSCELDPLSKMHHQCQCQ